MSSVLASEMTTGSTIVAAVQVVVVAALVFAGQLVIARSSTKANEKTTDVQDRANEVQDRANEIDGMDRLVHNLEARLEKVEARADALAERVRVLEDERVRDKSMIRALYGYVNVLREALRRLGQPIPEAPGGLEFTPDF